MIFLAGICVIVNVTGSVICIENKQSYYKICSIVESVLIKDSYLLIYRRSVHRRTVPF